MSTLALKLQPQDEQSLIDQNLPVFKNTQTNEVFTYIETAETAQLSGTPVTLNPGQVGITDGTSPVVIGRKIFPKP